MTRAFLKMSRKRRYRLIAAVRGPDTTEKDVVLKQEVTARIRAIMFKPDECLGSFRDDLLTQQQLSDIEGVLAASNPHYQAHLYEAVEATKRHRIWGGYGVKLLRVLLR